MIDEGVAISLEGEGALVAFAFEEVDGVLGVPAEECGEFSEAAEGGGWGFGEFEVEGEELAAIVTGGHVEHGAGDIAFFGFTRFP